jgi:dCMP deaminase
LTARLNRDQLGLLLAHAWSLRGTCARRRVGCVLMDADGYQVGAGYNGPPSGHPHCTDEPCAGASLASGEGLELCEAVHAEANALLRLADPRRVHAAYVTHSPCLHCVKLLMNTSCRRIVFAEPYAHDEAARALWLTTKDDGDRIREFYSKVFEVPERMLGDPKTWEHTIPLFSINDLRVTLRQSA